jgi:hypothetical protein
MATTPRKSSPATKRASAKAAAAAPAPARRGPTKTAAAPARRGPEGKAANPALSVVLDLDDLEREDAPGPFVAKHAGQLFTFVDPQDMDWQETLVAMSSGSMFLRMAVAEEDREAFFAEKMSNWKLEALVKRYRQHYGLPDVGEADALLP